MSEYDQTFKKERVSNILSALQREGPRDALLVEALLEAQLPLAEEASWRALAEAAELSALAGRPARRMGHDTITLSEARSRLDQRRFSRPNTHFSAFFKNYKKIIFSEANF